MRKRATSIIAKFLAFIMVLQMAVPTTAAYAAEPVDSTPLAEEAETSNLEFDSEASYVLATEDGKAAVVSADWGVGTYFTGTYKEASNKVSSDATMFKISSADVDQEGLAEGEIKVKITCTVGEESKDFSSEAIGSAAASPFASAGNNDYIITKTGENKGIIESVSNTRTALGLVQEDGKVLKQTMDNPAQAIPFEDGVEITFAKNPEAVDSFGSDLGFSADNTYVIATNDKALKPVKGGEVFDWTGRVKAIAAYASETNEIYDEEAQFTIVPTEDQTGTDEGEQKVTISFVNALDQNGAVCNLRTEDGQTYAWADGRTDMCTYIIKLGEDGKYTIKEDARKSRYLSVDANSEELNVLNESLTEEAATRFTIVSDYAIGEAPAAPADPAQFTITHVESGKLVKTYATVGTSLTVDGEEGQEGTTFTPAFGTNVANSGATVNTMGWNSTDYGKGIASVYWDGAINAGAATDVRVNDNTSGGGWESVILVPNGDGTVSFKDSLYEKWITVDNNILVCGRDLTEVTDNEKFVISSGATPNDVSELAIPNADRTQTSLKLTWTNPSCIYTGIEVYQKKTGEEEFAKIATLGNATSYVAEGLEIGTEYTYKVVVVNGRGDADDILSAGAEVTSVTRAGAKPATPANVTMEEKADAENTFTVSWDASENATHYRVLRAESMFGTYEEVTVVKETSADVTYEGNKYTNYYRVVALNNGGAGDEDFTYAEESEESEYTSLETELFGDHTLIFAPTDDMAKIDETLQALFDETHDAQADAQFKGEHWQVYFKPGDYTETSCIYLGFYTSINGLGQTPYDVRLNNVAIPAYLADNNATCNFWRSMENVSIIKTNNEQGNAGYGSWRGDWFNWGVAQAAPLRRVYSERPVAYDWNYGWASGGYVADSYFAGIDGEGNSAGTWSGQQFYTRNTVADGNVFGTTLNNFFQGVIAPNLPDADDVAAGAATELLSGEGYTNWKIADAAGAQQVFTNIEETKKIAEKPFLYIDDNGEYQVFVPAVKENTKGTSWSEDNMGEGTSIPLDQFYVAHPETDTAATINAQLAAGKHIYFTPGIYYAEETIKVTNANTILLGTGLATIVPDDGVSETIEYAAMEIADVDGVRVAGLIFDAGEHSNYLLVVGEKDSDADHSANPTVLQDLFFRVGGTTDVLTKSDDALEINSNDVIGDHFWIWRADHGAGVAWYGNESKHGLIVNGDDVTCYALFNEHFQEYHTLWNGENGATYFYQNETAYDPISQEAWMSPSRLPGGEPQNGYASYKVAEGVENHYAVGLGVYNVFIYTGPEYDSSVVQIQLDNAIEVPDAENVLVENACLQTFADANKVLQKINSVVNGMGDPVSSGKDPVTGETGTDWDRSFLRYYRNGESEGSYRDLQHIYQELIARYNSILAELGKVTDEADRARLEEALEATKAAIEACGISVTWPIQDETKEQVEDLEETLDNLETIVEEIEADYREELNSLIESYSYVEKGNNTDEAWNRFQDALNKAKELAGKTLITAEELQTVKDNLKAAFDMLDVTTKVGLWAEDIADQVYTGSAIKPEVVVKDGQTLLTKGKDYTVKYSANKSVGEAQIKITGKGNYKGTIIKHFDIVEKDLGSEGITANDVYAVINSKGKVTNPKVTVKYGKLTLKAATSKKANDYSVTGYEQALNEDGTAKAGTYTLTITGTGNYKGTTTVTYKVYENKTSVLKMSNAKISIAENSPVTVVDFFDTTKLPTFTVKIGKTELTADDYTITWPTEWKVGKNTVTFTAKEGASVPVSGTKTFKVTAVGGGSIKTENIVISGIAAEGYAYTGFAIEPVITVSQLDPNSGEVAKTLEKDTDYTVTYKSNVNAGNKATAVVKGINGYSGTVNLKFTINKVELTNDIVSLESDSVVYNKKGATPVIIATLGDYELKAGKDYKVTYANNKAVGTATATITGKGSFTGTLTFNYSVVEATKADVAINKVEMLNPKKASKVKVNVVEAATGKSLKKGTDYTAISYLVSDGEGGYRELTNNDLKDIEQLDVTVKVDLAGIYGTETEYFNLHIYSKKASTFVVELPQTSYDYTGKNIVPETVTVKVKDGKENGKWKYKELVEDVDFTYTPENYTNNVKVGTYKIAIKGEGIYGGTKNVSYKIVKQDMSWADWYAGIASWFDGLFE